MFDSQYLKLLTSIDHIVHSFHPFHRVPSISLLFSKPNLEAKERRRKWQLSDWWLHMYIFVYPARSPVAMVADGRHGPCWTTPGSRSQWYGCSKNNGTPKSSHFNKVWNHYKPSILGYPHFWKHPYHDGRTYFEKKNPTTLWVVIIQVCIYCNQMQPKPTLFFQFTNMLHLDFAHFAILRIWCS